MTHVLAGLASTLPTDWFIVRVLSQLTYKPPLHYITIHILISCAAATLSPCVMFCCQATKQTLPLLLPPTPTALCSSTTFRAAYVCTQLCSVSIVFFNKYCKKIFILSGISTTRTHRYFFEYIKYILSPPMMTFGDDCSKSRQLQQISCCFLTHFLSSWFPTVIFEVQA